MLSTSIHLCYQVFPFVVLNMAWPRSINVYGSLYLCLCTTDSYCTNSVLFPPEWQGRRVKTKFGPAVVPGKLQHNTGEAIEKCCLLA